MLAALVAERRCGNTQRAGGRGRQRGDGRGRNRAASPRLPITCAPRNDSAADAFGGGDLGDLTNAGIDLQEILDLVVDFLQDGDRVFEVAPDVPRRSISRASWR